MPNRIRVRGFGQQAWLTRQEDVGLVIRQAGKRIGDAAVGSTLLNALLIVELAEARSAEIVRPARAHTEPVDRIPRGGYLPRRHVVLTVDRTVE